MSDVRVRTMTTGDLGPVGLLARQLVRQHHQFDPDRFFLTPDVEVGYRRWFTSQLGRPGVVLLVAELDQQVAGYLYASLEERDWAMLLDDHGALHDVYVDERFRRRGVARALVLAGVAALEQRGAPRVVLSSASQNREARALFASLGFRETMVEMTRTGTATNG
jgi:ribosomal protein S18 acetylase RimI-like enzyme